MTNIDSVDVGTHLPAYVGHVEADHIRLVTLLLRDSNPIHFDLNAAAASGLGDREVNQGGATMAHIYNMLLVWTGSRGAPARMACRFRGNVFAGDAVVCGGVVTAVRKVATGHEIDCDVWAERGAQERVIDGTATLLVED